MTVRLKDKRFLNTKASLKNERGIVALPPEACHPADGLGVFEVGESFHQISSVLGGDGGVPPQKLSLRQHEGVRAKHWWATFYVSQSSLAVGLACDMTTRHDSEIMLSNIKQ